MMHLVVRGHKLSYEFYEDGELLAHTAFNFVTSSSSGKITGVGCVVGGVRGVFGFFRLNIFLNDRRTHSFRKNFLSKLHDRTNDVQLWRGEIIAGGKVVGRFERSLESLIAPVFELELEDLAHLPLAMCYLPYAVGNRHL